MKRNSTKYLIFIYFLSIGFTWVEGEAGGGVFNRIIYADLIGLIIIIFSLLGMVISTNGLVMPKEYLFYIPFMLVYTISGISSESPEKFTLHLLIHAYIYVLSLLLLNVFLRQQRDIFPSTLLNLVLYSGFIIAAIGLIQFFILPNWFSGSHGGLSGTFRNTGQAGSFFSLYLAIIIPGFLVKLIKPQPFNIFCAAIIVIALVFTFKRAAWIGFVVGLILLSLVLVLSGSKRDKKVGITILISTAVISFLVTVLFTWGLENIDGMKYRFEYKLNSDTISKFEQGFLNENLEATFAALADRPLFGVGPGNIMGVYTAKHEIHSSYMKILATTGLTGTLAYIIFMVFMLVKLGVRKHHTVYSRYIKYFFPFFIGLIISWSYTYHLRKREFWVMFAILAFFLILHRSIVRSKQASI